VFTLRPCAIAAAAGLALDLLAPNPSWTQQGTLPGAGSTFAVRLGDPALGAAVARLLASAQEVASERACAGLLDELVDRQGRPLRVALSTTGRTFSQYLEWVIFYEGDGLHRYDRPGVFAVACPCSRVVRICTPEARRLVRDNPRLARAILIHEALHTLGLPENPPSSCQITDLVLALCR
jgi:hypothetical protein